MVLQKCVPIRDVCLFQAYSAEMILRVTSEQIYCRFEGEKKIGGCGSSCHIRLLSNYLRKRYLAEMTLPAHFKGSQNLMIFLTSRKSIRSPMQKRASLILAKPCVKILPQ